MKVPAIGSPSPVAAANELILKRSMAVVELTSVWSLNAAGWLNKRKIYLRYKTTDRMMREHYNAVGKKHTGEHQNQLEEWAGGIERLQRSCSQELERG